MAERASYERIAREVDERGVWTCLACEGIGRHAEESCVCCGGLGVHWPGEECVGHTSAR